MNQPTNGGIVPPKRTVKLTKEATVNEDGSIDLLLNFADNTTAVVRLPDTVRAQAAAFGALAKIAGLAAGDKTQEELKTDLNDLVEQWKRGEWRQRAEGGQGTSIIQRALMEYRGKTANEIRDFLKDKTMQQKEDMKKIPGLAPIVARLEAEEAAKLLAKGKITVPTEDLLAGL